jgi:hypothetical protein
MEVVVDLEKILTYTDNSNKEKAPGLTRTMERSTNLSITFNFLIICR